MQVQAGGRRLEVQVRRTAWSAGVGGSREDMLEQNMSAGLGLSWRSDWIARLAWGKTSRLESTGAEEGQIGQTD